MSKSRAILEQIVGIRLGRRVIQFEQEIGKKENPFLSLVPNGVLNHLRDLWIND